MQFKYSVLCTLRLHIGPCRCLRVKGDEFTQALINHSILLTPLSGSNTFTWSFVCRRNQNRLKRLSGILIKRPHRLLQASTRMFILLSSFFFFQGFCRTYYYVRDISFTECQPMIGVTFLSMYMTSLYNKQMALQLSGS